MIQVWNPNHHISKPDMNDYLTFCQNHDILHEDEALEILYKRKYNIESCKKYIENKLPELIEPPNHYQNILSFDYNDLY